MYMYVCTLYMYMYMYMKISAVYILCRSYILVHTYTVYPTLCTRYNIVTLVQFKIAIRIWLVKEKCANSYVLLTSVNEVW